MKMINENTEKMRKILFTMFLRLLNIGPTYLFLSFGLEVVVFFVPRSCLVGYSLIEKSFS